MKLSRVGGALAEKQYRIRSKRLAISNGLLAF